MITKAQALASLPDLPPELAGWEWRHTDSGAYRLLAPDLAWATKFYTRPERAIAEARRRVLSQPKENGIKTFSQALPILAAHGYGEPRSIGGGHWIIDDRRLDKGSIIAWARELAGQVASAAPPIALALTAAESADLATHEATIAAGLDTFIAVGEALAEIRDQRLYRATHASFADYLAGTWPQIGGRRQADRLIVAAEVERDLRPIGLTLSNESQARPLAGLAPEERRTAMQAAIEAAGGQAPTAKQIAAAIKIPPITDDDHIRAAQKLLADAARAGERTGTRLYQEAYGHAQKVQDTLSRQALTQQIDRATNAVAERAPRVCADCGGMYGAPGSLALRG